MLGASDLANILTKSVHTERPCSFFDPIVVTDRTSGSTNHSPRALSPSLMISREERCGGLPKEQECSMGFKDLRSFLIDG